MWHIGFRIFLGTLCVTLSNATLVHTGFNIRKNAKSRSSNTVEVTKSQSLDECNVKCHRQQKCVSFNFDGAEFDCELLRDKDMSPNQLEGVFYGIVLNREGPQYSKIPNYRIVLFEPDDRRTEAFSDGQPSQILPSVQPAGVMAKVISAISLANGNSLLLSYGGLTKLSLYDSSLNSVTDLLFINSYNQVTMAVFGYFQDLDKIVVCGLLDGGSLECTFFSLTSQTELSTKTVIVDGTTISLVFCMIQTAPTTAHVIFTYYSRIIKIDAQAETLEQIDTSTPNGFTITSVGFHLPTCTKFGDQAVCCGGFDEKACYALNMTSLNWATFPSMQQDRHIFTLQSLGDSRMIAVGGISFGGLASSVDMADDMEIYENGEWQIVQDYTLAQGSRTRAAAIFYLG